MIHDELSQLRELFARTLYEALLGLSPSTDAAQRGYQPRGGGIKPMHVAMREARLAIAKTDNGAQSWGAYQHYGNPYMYLFDPASKGMQGRG